MNGSTPLKLSHVMLSAVAIVGIAAVGVSQSPLPGGPEVGNPASAAQNQGVGTAPAVQDLAQLFGSEGAIGTTAAIPAMGARPTTGGNPLEGVGAAGEMIGFSNYNASGTQTITLVHTGKSWMAVYHIDRSGTIRLVSSRPIDADFSLQLNATSPLPEEIREIGRR